MIKTTLENIWVLITLIPTAIRMLFQALVRRLYEYTK